MTCMCGDPECPSCGVAQGTVVDLPGPMIHAMTARLQVVLTPALKAQIERAAINESMRVGQRISASEWVREACRFRLATSENK